MALALKRASFVVSVAVLGIWLSGSGFLLWAVKPGATLSCPFRAYVALWPVFVLLPEQGRMEFVSRSFEFCGVNR